MAGKNSEKNVLSIVSTAAGHPRSEANNNLRYSTTYPAV
jgi:hypothetical protein